MTRFPPLSGSVINRAGMINLHVFSLAYRKCVCGTLLLLNLEGTTEKWELSLFIYV